MAFTKGTANFTNGSKTVTGVSLTAGQLAYFASGTAVFIQSKGKLIEATGLPKDGNGDVIPNQFLLRGNWTGPTGSYDFVAFDTIEGLRDAVQSARGFSNQLQEVLENFGTILTGTTPTVTVGNTAVVPFGYIINQGQSDIDNFINTNQTTLDRVNVEQKLKNNAVVYLEFTKDEGWMHDGLTVSRDKATHLITYACATKATAQTADGRIVEVQPDTTRIAWSNGKAVGLLSGPIAENLFTHSEDLIDSSWDKISLTQTLISEVDSPLYRNASFIKFNRMEAASTGESALAISKSVEPGDRATVSCIFKPDEATSVLFRLNAEKDCRVNINPGTGEINSSDFTGYVSISPLRDGSYRITITDSGLGVSPFNAQVWLSRTGTVSTGGETWSAGEGGYLTGLQINTGEPASYVPTTTSSNISDEASADIVVDNFNSDYGYIFLEYEINTNRPLTFTCALGNDNNTTNNGVTLYTRSDRVQCFLTSDVGSTSSTVSGVFGNSAQEKIKALVRYDIKTSNFVLFCNGVKGDTALINTPTEWYNVQRIISLAKRYSQTDPVDGAVAFQKVGVSGGKITDAEAIALTILEDE